MRGYFEIRNLSKSFEGLKALNGVSVDIVRNKITSIIGPNGAGKTTLFNCITGFLQPDEGEICYKGREVTGLHPSKIVELGIARTWQDLRIFEKITVLENVLVGGRDFYFDNILNLFKISRKLGLKERENREKALFILESLALVKYRHELAGSLSYGDQKILAVARILATDPEMVLLDEPASGITSAMIDRISDVMRGLINAGKTVLIIDHNMDAVMNVSDEIIVLDHGTQIASGTPEEIRNDKEVINIYLGKV